MNDPILESGLETEDYSDSGERLNLDIPASAAGIRFDAALASLLTDYSRSRLVRWIESGRVLLDGRVVAPKTKVWGGESVTVEIETDPQVQAFQPEPVDFPVIYEDASLVVIDKPAGLVVHPAAGNWSGTLLNGLLYRYPDLAQLPRAGIVHRLDKDTSGLMVVARTLTAQTHLVRQLQARSVTRLYLAVAQGRLNTDATIDRPIGRHPRDRLKMAVVEHGKPAITHYRVLMRYRNHTLVQCKLETGRTHQIRVHMQSIGHALAADPVYGGRPPAVTSALATVLQQFNRQALHAAELALLHPDDGRLLGWKAELPTDMVTLLAALQADLEAED
ncbi:23S rRNA pseudouridine(1911/1915/1917) synthase RluD [Chitinimonas lacunae]|uniref:Pseudouridine synthase n=1 Tax=Chitinimonas lacunae TaxID=1963018 RepID=A0ABV8MMZ3_9NEIS